MERDLPADSRPPQHPGEFRSRIVWWPPRIHGPEPPPPHTPSTPQRQAIEKAHGERRLPALRVGSVPFGGPGVLLLVTAHADSAGGAADGAFCGRIIVPRLQAGTPADQWFMLQVRRAGVCL